jgi:hypothetical protein
MRLVTGDVIQSIHTGNSFTVEYVSEDGNFFILRPREGEKSRGYDMNNFKRSFVKVPNDSMQQPVSNRDELPEETGSLLQLRNLIRQRHAEWSQATFGDVGPVGPLKHLSKEALEAAAEPDDLSEWADMQFLLWDAQRRAGLSDGEITAAMEEKLKVNMARQWPEPKEGEPRLHIKAAPQQISKCWCHTCRPVTTTDMRFVVCPDCGNKRCPRANDHRNVCSGSNEPGQEGSAYPAAPQQEV